MKKSKTNHSPFTKHICDLTLSQATNFRLFQTERVWRRKFQIWWKWHKLLQMGRKHCGEKEKLLLTSNFSFSNSVFKSLVLQTHENQGLFGKGLTCLQNTAFENSMGKGRNEQFLFFPHHFLLYWIYFHHLYQIYNCRLQTLSVWDSLKFVVWWRDIHISVWIWVKSYVVWSGFDLLTQSTQV